MPATQVDETSKHEMAANGFSNWTLVKAACEKGDRLKDFLEWNVEGSFLIVHLDTDVRNEPGYDVLIPEEIKTEEDCRILIENVAVKMTEWMGEELAGKSAFAIAVQETEAWILAQYTDKNETGLLPNVKERLEKAISENLSKSDLKNLRSSNSTKERAKLLSYSLRKPKILKAVAKKNVSLSIFLDRLIEFQPKE